MRWRIPGLDGRLTYGELFRDYPFTVLDEGERHLLAGLCGRIWTLARDYPRLDGPETSRAGTSPAPCASCSATGSSRPTAGSALVSEARVQPVDRTASLRLRTLWKVIGPFERLVGAEAIARGYREISAC